MSQNTSIRRFVVYPSTLFRGRGNFYQVCQKYNVKYWRNDRNSYIVEMDPTKATQFQYEDEIGNVFPLVQEPDSAIKACASIRLAGTIHRT